MRKECKLSVKYEAINTRKKPALIQGKPLFIFIIYLFCYPANTTLLLYAYMSIYLYAYMLIC